MNNTAPPSVPYSLSGKRVWIAGHGGMVGQALLRRIEQDEAFRQCTILTAGRSVLDLCRQQEVEDWVQQQQPQAVILAAARVGGIHANHHYPADFLYDNLMIEANIIHAAYRAGVEKLLFIGSSCIYPRLAQQPICEDALLTGALEPTNEGYAVAKIAGIKLCQTYRRQHQCDYSTAMPTNLYGPEDNFHPKNSHVPAALLQRFHDAAVNKHEVVTVWGTGKPRREFMYVDDMADACLFLLQHYSSEKIINIGSGKDVSIAAFAGLIADIVGFQGRIVYDSSHPDGTPRKVLDVSALRQLGWRSTISLKDGLRRYYQWFLDNHHRLRHHRHAA